MATVVNVRVKYIRPQYHDLQEWCADENNVYIGRANIVFINGIRYPKIPSIWANPYKVKDGVTSEQVLEKYKRYIKQKLRNGEIKIADLLALEGKNLGCWCKDSKGQGACHGDILVELMKCFAERSRRP